MYINLLICNSIIGKMFEFTECGEHAIYDTSADSDETFDVYNNSKSLKCCGNCHVISPLAALHKNG